MKTNFEMVKEFHDTFNKIKDPKKPTDLDVDHKLLRHTLIKEEYLEVCEELDKYPTDITKLAKELADLLYVVYGTGAAFGIPLDKVYEEVHRSNMSKLGVDGKPIYREDGKVMKGPNYTPADVESIISKLK